MYCNKCGFLLDDDDLFCSQCGNKVKALKKQEEPPEQEEKEEKKPIHYDEFKWNVKEFNAEKKYEDVVFDWSKKVEEDNEQEEEKTDLNTAEGTKSKEEVPLPDDSEFEKGGNNEMLAKTDESSVKELEEHIFGAPIKNDKEERFFTFTKKNEEFQKLLDEEYEKIKKNSNKPVEEKDEQDEDIKSSENKEFGKEQTELKGEANEKDSLPFEEIKIFEKKEDDILDSKIEAPEPQFIEEAPGNDSKEDKKSVDTHEDENSSAGSEPNKDGLENAIKSEEISKNKRAGKKQKNAEENKKQGKEQIDEMAAAREAFFAKLDEENTNGVNEQGKPLVMDNERLKEYQNRGNTQKAAGNDEKLENSENAHSGWAAALAKEKSKIAKETEVSEIKNQEDKIEMKDTDKKHDIAQGEIKDNKTEGSKPVKMGLEDDHSIFVQRDKEEKEYEVKEEESKSIGKQNVFINIIIALLVIIIIFEGTCLIAQKWWPDSSFGQAVIGIQNTIIEKIISVFKSIKS